MKNYDLYICEYKDGGADPFVISAEDRPVKNVFEDAFKDLHGGYVDSFYGGYPLTAVCISDIGEVITIYIEMQLKVYD